MTPVVSIAPVQKTVTVHASQRIAFETFTAHIGTWWKKGGGIGESKLVDVRMEPRVGGRLYEIDEDGSEVKWGTVLAWDPHDRVVFTWQITSEWKPSPVEDAAVHSEVEVRFVAEGSDTTRVELDHRHFERMGARPGTTMRTGVDGGWPERLEMFAKAANEARR